VILAKFFYRIFLKVRTPPKKIFPTSSETKKSFWRSSAPLLFLLHFSPQKKLFAARSVATKKKCARLLSVLTFKKEKDKKNRPLAKPHFFCLFAIKKQ